MKPALEGTQRSAKSTTATSKAFNEEERGAVRDRVQEMKAGKGEGERRPGEDRRDAGTGSRHGQAASYYYQRKRARPLAKALVRDARLCQGRQGRLLLPGSGEVQDEIRDVKLQRQVEPRRGQYVASRLRIEGVDSGRRSKDRRACEKSGELRTALQSTTTSVFSGPNNPSLHNARCDSGILSRVGSEFAPMQS